MNGRIRLSQSAHALRPLEQGDLDALCGLYAIINGVRVLLHQRRPLKRHEVGPLFDAGVAVLSRRRSLRRVLGSGISDRLWARLCDAVLEQASTASGEKLVASYILRGVTPLSSRDAVRRIRRSVREGSPVLVALMGRYDHWSVVVRFTATSLGLFDSYGYRRVMVSSITLNAAASGKPHEITRTGVVALQLQQE